MENELDSFIDNTDQESHLDPSVTEGNLIVSILTKPTATIRFFTSSKYRKTRVTSVLFGGS